jgi:hypothetical protein
MSIKRLAKTIWPRQVDEKNAVISQKSLWRFSTRVLFGLSVMKPFFHRREKSLADSKKAEIGDSGFCSECVLLFFSSFHKILIKIYK